jgi:hypothetical protein
LARSCWRPPPVRAASTAMAAASVLRHRVNVARCGRSRFGPTRAGRGRRCA